MGGWAKCLPKKHFSSVSNNWSMKIDTLMQTLASRLSYRCLTSYSFQHEGFFQSAMFLASTLRRGCHPPVNILKFNIPGGGWMRLWGHLLRTWPPDMRSKNYFTWLVQYDNTCSPVSVLADAWPQSSSTGPVQKINHIADKAVQPFLETFINYKKLHITSHTSVNMKFTSFFLS
jgi:hypothetical protein